jgi:ribosomal protein L7/L12
LKELKIDSVPSNRVKEGVTKDEAEALKIFRRRAGAVLSLNSQTQFKN